MTRPSTDTAQWTMVDEGWGRRAVDFATLSSPGNCRKYAQGELRDGLPLRAEINVVGYLARKPEGAERS